MRSIEPDDATAPAEAGNAEPLGIALAGKLCPRRRRVEILHDLLVRYFSYDGADILDGSELAHITLARIKLRRYGQIAELGEAPAHILDVFVDPENFLHHEYHGKRPAACRHGAIAWNFSVLDGYFDFSGGDTAVIRCNGLG